MIDDWIDNLYSFDDDAKEYIFAYLDILGYRDFIRRKGHQELYNRICQAYNNANSYSEKPVRTPMNLKIRIYSDNLLIYMPLEGEWISDSRKEVFLIGICASFQFFCLVNHGLMIRGAINRGKCMIDDFVFGEAFTEAHDLESKRADWPRILISDKVVKDLERFDYIPSTKMIRKDEDGLHYVDYLGNLALFADKNPADGLPDSKMILSDHRIGFMYLFSEFRQGKWPVTISGLRTMSSIVGKFKDLADYHNTVCAEFGYDKEPDRLTIGSNHWNEKLHVAARLFENAYENYPTSSFSSELHDKLDEVLREYDGFVKYLDSDQGSRRI